jgi:hypothetical protein
MHDWSIAHHRRIEPLTGGDQTLVTIESCYKPTMIIGSTKLVQTSNRQWLCRYHNRIEWQTGGDSRLPPPILNRQGYSGLSPKTSPPRGKIDGDGGFRTGSYDSGYVELGYRPSSFLEKKKFLISFYSSLLSLVTVLVLHKQIGSLAYLWALFRACLDPLDTV